MFIAFEGPDNTGKSTSAATLASDNVALYNATKAVHESQVRSLLEPDWVTTYDRIDWFTHMVYRLALPDRDWKDERPRTVFTMPDTHLVVKLHRPDLAGLIADELYPTGTLAQVNPMYYYFADFFMALNVQRDYALFKTVSIMEVANDPTDGSFSQKLVRFSSPVISEADALNSVLDHHATEDSLLELLRAEEHWR